MEMKVYCSLKKLVLNGIKVGRYVCLLMENNAGQSTQNSVLAFYMGAV